MRFGNNKIFTAISIFCFLLIISSIFSAVNGEKIFGNIYNTPIDSLLQDPSGRKLSLIKNIQQAPGSYICGAITIKMVMNYYFSQSENIMDIYNEVRSLTHNRGNSIERMTKYLINNGLYASIIQFTDLKTILDYCKNNQIPAIMIINALENIYTTHTILFTGYNENKGIVHILDPAYNSRKVLTVGQLESNFTHYIFGYRTIPTISYQGNNIILVSDRLIGNREFKCSCKKINFIEDYLIDAIRYFTCYYCQVKIYVHRNGL